MNKLQWTTRTTEALSDLEALMSQYEDPPFEQLLARVRDDHGLNDEQTWMVGINSTYPTGPDNEFWNVVKKLPTPTNEEEKPIEVPRDPTIGNKGVTKDIESFLLDLLSDNPDEPYHLKDLSLMVNRRFAMKYGDDLAYHIARAIDMLTFNKMAKKVAPNTWESIDGPDDEMERTGGYAPEGEFAHRTYKVGAADTSHIKKFNDEIKKAELSVKMLKNMGQSRDQAQQNLLNSGNFHPVAVKLAIKKSFALG